MTGILEGKVALVTGGASGIGRATAVVMAREGARVAVTDRAEADAAETVGLINAAGGQAIAIGGDVTREADVAAMVARTVAAFGRIDCAFNNAGIAGRAVGPVGQRTHELSQDAFDRMLAVNLTGVFLCLKYEIAQMLSQGGGGAIVNTASIAGLIGLATSAHYVAAKHGVVGLTQTAAWEHAADGIRVNAVGPGFISTPLLEKMDPKVRATLEGRHALKRLGTAEEVAALVAWLASDDASFATGAYYAIDGGYLAQ